MSEQVGDEPAAAGYEEWLDALADGEGFYLQGPNGATVPPATTAASGSLERRPLPDTGSVEAASAIQVPHPDFADDAPYAIAVASFGPVRLTGQVRGIDPAEVERGLAVEATAVSSADGDRLVGLEPVETEVSDS